MTRIKHRILFKGYYNVHNFGDDLLFLALLNFFENQMGWQKDEITLFVEPEEQSLKKLGYQHPYTLLPYLDPVKAKHAKLKNNKTATRLAKLVMIFHMIGCLIAALIYRLTKVKIGNHKNIKFFKKLDIIHYIGGGYFNTRLTWGTQLLIYELFFTTMAKLINPNLQIIGTGLGIGPVGTKLYKSLFKRFAQKFDYIFVREKESEHFVESLGTAKHVKCIGDDVILLLPYFQEIKKGTLAKPQFGLNLKYDNVHQYGDAQEFFTQLFYEQQLNGEKIIFFNFGRDHLALSQLPNALAESLSIQSCYEIGLKHFSQGLAESRKGIGFAYHFAVLCALMNIPSANIYFDDYYRQKTGGVMQLLCDKHITLPYQKLKKLSPTHLLSDLESVDNNNVLSIFNQLTLQYRKAYHELETTRRSNGRHG